MVEKDNLWHGQLKARYENLNYNILLNSFVNNKVLQKQSLWWRDISGIGAVFNLDVNWFNESICGKIGDDNLVDFWQQTWIGLKSLAAVFPDLFRRFGAGPVKIILMGEWIGEN